MRSSASRTVVFRIVLGSRRTGEEGKSHPFPGSQPQSSKYVLFMSNLSVVLMYMAIIPVLMSRPNK